MLCDRSVSYTHLPVEIEELTLQESEVEEVIWMDYEECMQEVQEGTLANCIYEEEFRMVGEYLKEYSKE